MELTEAAQTTLKCVTIISAANRCNYFNIKQMLAFSKHVNYIFRELMGELRVLD